MCELALDPDKKGNNHARVLSKALNSKSADEKLYSVPTAVWDENLNRSVDGTVLVRLPHEIFHEVWQSNPKSMQVRYQDPSDWDVPAFTKHPIAVANGVTNVTPITIYADATPYKSDDTAFYAIYLQVAVSSIACVCTVLHVPVSVRCVHVYGLVTCHSMVLDVVFPTRSRQAGPRQ